MVKKGAGKLPKAVGIRTVRVEYGEVTRCEQPAKPPGDPRSDKGHGDLERNPASWRSHARHQLYVAQVLHREQQSAFAELGAWSVGDPEEKRNKIGERLMALFDALAYHLGMALELAAKGAVAEITGSAPPMGKKAHDLLHLSREAGLALSPEEEEAARRLTAAVEWWGRYPVPKKPAVYVESFTNGTRKWSPESEIETVESLLQRLGALDEPTTSGRS